MKADQRLCAGQFKSLGPHLRLVLEGEAGKVFFYSSFQLCLKFYGGQPAFIILWVEEKQLVLSVQLGSIQSAGGIVHQQIAVRHLKFL